MKFKDKFSEHYADLLSGQYDCLDRIVLNAYYPQLLDGGGVRDWWGRLHGSDSGLTTAVAVQRKLLERVYTIFKTQTAYDKRYFKTQNNEVITEQEITVAA